MTFVPAGIAVIGLAVVWRGASSVTERALWALVASWLVLDFALWALYFGLNAGGTEQPLPNWVSLLLKGVFLAFATLLALYAARRVAYGGWFVIAVYLAREGTHATAWPGMGLVMPDLLFRLYVPGALLAYLLMLLGVAFIASDFGSRAPGSRRAQLIALVGFTVAVVVGKAIVYSVGVFAFSAWWTYYTDSIPSYMARAVDFFGWSIITLVVYALLRWSHRETRQVNVPRVDG